VAALWHSRGRDGAFYYYGILKQLPQFPSGNGFPFLLGLAGGYLGREALAGVANLIFPRVPGSAGRHT
jgi:hypothetical protein